MLPDSFGQVCRRFNEIGSKVLSRGFIQVERRHSAVYKRVKSMLPRRESERKIHPLARHCDILSAVETRISMLSMTFMKYIENNVCCFIPGKVLDEMERVLTLVEKGGPPPRTHELLQELRDISSMAMEHFDENILPNLKLQLNRAPVIPFGASTSKSPRFVVVQHTISDEIHKVKRQNKSNKQCISVLNQHIIKLFKKMKRQSVRSKTQTLKIREQERKIQEQSIKIQEQETSIADLKKHTDEWDQKFSDLTSELIRAREELISKKTLSPKQQTTSYTHSLQPPKFYKSNIQPRMAQILAPRQYELLHNELERKRKSNINEEIPAKLSKPVNKNDEITNKINEKLTSNILRILNSESDSAKIEENTPYILKLKDDHYNTHTTSENDRGISSRKSDFSSFISSSLESLLKTPLSSIKSRKRKISEDIDLK